MKITSENAKSSAQSGCEHQYTEADSDGQHIVGFFCGKCHALGPVFDLSREGDAEKLRAFLLANDAIQA